MSISRTVRRDVRVIGKPLVTGITFIRPDFASALEACCPLSRSAQRNNGRSVLEKEW